jgi:signal transduction histidine kinase
MAATLLTEFLPAERSTRDEVGEQRRQLTEDTLKQVLDGCPNPAAVLNQNRQVVFCNRALVDLTRAADEQEIWGARTGEVLGCQHSTKTDGGCGTTEFCRVCGAALAIRDGQLGKPSTRDCRITRCGPGRSQALDLRITVAPFRLAERFVVCAIEDTSHEKRRLALERIFFHDILNTAMALDMNVESLRSAAAAGALDGAVQSLSRCTSRLLAEIDGQRLLLSAEDGTLSQRPSDTTTMRVLRDLTDQLVYEPAARQKQLMVAATAEDAPLTIDVTLLGRVLVNMMKNALEAVTAGQTVTADCRAVDGEVEFSVRNPGELPRDVQLQIFQRSFSTKGPGRGLGTYSMKLFAEYLGGRVWLESSASAGTAFYVRVPSRVGPAR